MPFPPARGDDDAPPLGKPRLLTKKHEIVIFSSTAIALYGYDQGMMSLINTNRSYLGTMSIAADSPLVGIIVSVYYLGCAVGAVLSSYWADTKGRKPSILACLVTTVVGNLLMFVAGIGSSSRSWGGPAALACMMVGRVVLGLGVGGIDATIPVYSSELTKDKSRGRALAQEFQMNIFGLLLAFSINLGVTIALGKDNQWAWRIPIIAMQVFPLLLITTISRLPESPRWFISQARHDDAMGALVELYDEPEAKKTLDEIHRAQAEESDKKMSYFDMVLPGRSQFHPTMLTIMGQINQALTGYGAVSVYGPQIFELLGFGVRDAEYVTLIRCFIVGRPRHPRLGCRGPGLRHALRGHGDIRYMLAGHCLVDPYRDLPERSPGAGEQCFCHRLGTCQFCRHSLDAYKYAPLPPLSFRISFKPPWQPDRKEPRSTDDRLVVFNNLRCWLFLVFAATNAVAGWSTWAYSPETGGRSFEANQEFFISAARDSSWLVRKVDGGKFLRMPRHDERRQDGKLVQSEVTPLLQSQSDSL